MVSVLPNYLLGIHAVLWLLNSVKIYPKRSLLRDNSLSVLRKDVQREFGSGARERWLPYGKRPTDQR